MESKSTKSLVIAEKPSVARMIAEALGCKEKKAGYLEGKSYVISWCIGHLVMKAPPDMYDAKYKTWNLNTLPIIPEDWKHQIIPSTKSQFMILKDLMKRKDVGEVVVATDCGREGEAIARLVYDMAKCKKPLYRFWTNSLEENAIIEGFRNLRPGSEFDSLFEAAECRARADWLVGMNLTRLYSLKYGDGKVLNVGRVKSPTLQLIVDREQKIRDFTKEPYFKVHLHMNGIDAVSESVKTLGEANDILEACERRPAYIENVTREKKKVNPPLLYDMTTLQRDANRCFSMSAKDTLNTTQQLYEKRLVTYPRTDSRYLSDDMGDTVAAVYMAIQKCIFQNIQAPSRGKTPEIDRVLNSKKVSDHHAIIPTVEIAKKELLNDLSENEQRILKLIINQFLSAMGQVHVYESIHASFDCNGYHFTASGKTIIQNGWKTREQQFSQDIRKKEEKISEENDQSDVGSLTGIHKDLHEGIAVSVNKIAITEHETKPPTHLTEESLLALMEKAGQDELLEDAERSGLGTTATRADIIEGLIKAGFVERRKKQLLSTEAGEYLCRILPEQLVSAKLTADWENRLTNIAKGIEDPAVFMKDIREFIAYLTHQELITQ